jgi:Fe-Mn family superoxide dismutase
MTITVRELPYAKDALEPHMSARTVEFHYEKHHKGYAKKLNGLIEGTALEKKDLESIIRATAGDQKKKTIFNNAAQVWNHTFFWEGMKPGAGGGPEGKLGKLIDEAFGNITKFKETFVERAEKRFGSGYVWLVLHDGKLELLDLPNAETPLAGEARPLLNCDVWEHAYYLDYQNARAKFVKAFLDHLINWEAVAERLDEAGKHSVRRVA